MAMFAFPSILYSFNSDKHYVANGTTVAACFPCFRKRHFIMSCVWGTVKLYQGCWYTTKNWPERVMLSVAKRLKPPLIRHCRHGCFATPSMTRVRASVITCKLLK